MKDQNQRVVMIEVSKLSNHPTADLVPMFREDHPQCRALAESIEADGILQPLLVDRQYRVLDGRHRLRIARDRNLKQVPCIIVSDEQAATTALNTALSRRDFNEGQRGLMIALLFPQTVEERQARRLQNLKVGKHGKGSFPPRSPEVPEEGSGASVAGLAALHDVSRPVMERAYKILDQPTARRERAIRDVMVEGKGIGAVVAGFAGADATQDKPRPAHNYSKLIGNGIRSLSRFGNGFSRIPDPKTAGAIIRDAEKLCAKMPEVLVKPILRSARARLAELGGKEAR